MDCLCDNLMHWQLTASRYLNQEQTGQWFEPRMWHASNWNSYMLEKNIVAVMPFSKTLLCHKMFLRAGTIRRLTQGLGLVSLLEDGDSIRSGKYGNTCSPHEHFIPFLAFIDLPVTSPMLYRLRYWGSATEKFKVEKANIEIPK